MSVWGTHFLAIRCTKSVTWFEEVTEWRDVIAVEDDVKIFLTDNARRLYYLAQFLRRLFDDDLQFPLTGMEVGRCHDIVEYVRENRGILVEHTETAVERIGRLYGSREANHRVLENVRISNAAEAAHLSYVPTNHEFLRFLSHIEKSQHTMEYFINELFRHALTHFSRIERLWMPLPLARIYFLRHCAKLLRDHRSPTTSTPGVGGMSFLVRCRMRPGPNDENNERC